MLIFLSFILLSIIVFINKEYGRRKYTELEVIMREYKLLLNKKVE